jgi:hypothetical protein
VGWTASANLAPVFNVFIIGIVDYCFVVHIKLPFLIVTNQSILLTQE